MKPSVLLSLGARLHPPLPITPRESQLLLSLLTTSFRKHLNQEYPTPGKGEADHFFFSGPGVEKSYGSTKPSQNRDASTAVDLMSVKAADLHFKSVLTNPLFVGPKRRACPPRRRGNDGWEGNIQDARHRLRKLASDPMGFFEENVAAGTATFELAATCLKTHMNDVLRSPVLSVKEAMAKSEAGTKVMVWLVSSGLADSKEVVENVDFACAAIPFLVAKGHTETYITWMEKLVSADPGTDVFRQAAVRLARRQSLLIRKLIESEWRYGEGWDAALKLFGQLAARTYRRLPPYLRESITALAFNNILLSPAGRDIYNRLVNRKNHTSPFEFDRFRARIPMFLTVHKHLVAELQLYHPTEPSADLALGVLKALEVPSGSPRTRTVRRRWVKFALETAHVLLSQERWTDGVWVLEFLQKNLPEELGIQREEVRSTQQTSTAPSDDPRLDEKVNVKLLERLDLN